MGLDYSYEIFTPARNVARALAELVELAPRTRRVPPLTLTVPGGDQLVVPFTSNFKSDPVDCSTDGTLELDTSIMVGVDDAVREYVEGRGLDELDELGRVQIGYIYLTVRFAPTLHPHYASLQFTAATSRMSRMFEQSASIRAVFTGLTAASGGACCMLDTESDTFQICWLNGQRTSETVPGPRFTNCRDLVAAWPDQG
ncbi:MULTISPECIES: hypothetical protein [unclassified Streptomyces]|uniref:hypothetical protein n=1 Tax=unclassified Streptomyces TaxID=2593676 RepID=UPI000851C389|nr:MULTISPECIES: hypothetical protein [unclassified Streptomyces]MDQ0701030.1 hypothetical protein [Streptomyces sp. W4I9-2]MDX3488259.1 hypothetical protein [Streptomyces sp. ID05-18]